MKKPTKNHQLYDRHGNKVYAPEAPFRPDWKIDCGIYQELIGRWHRREVDNPPVLLTGIWDQ